MTKVFAIIAPNQTDGSPGCKNRTPKEVNAAAVLYREKQLSVAKAGLRWPDGHHIWRVEHHQV